MAITSLRLQNFTVFEDFEMNLSPGINVIIGENGTGKTHLLKAIYSFCECEIGVASDCDAWVTDFGAKISECFRVDSLHELHNNNRDSGLYADGIVVSFTTKNKPDPYEMWFRNNAVEMYLSPNKNKKRPGSSMYIPSKDMLTHARGLLTMAGKYSRDMPFDKTLLDIIQSADNWKLDEVPKLAEAIIPKLEKVIDGMIVQQDGEFFVLKSNGDKIRFSCEAEGVKKFGLLWQLLMTGAIEENSVLLWDEPEANVNPKLIPILVDILIEFARHGVQVFIASHDYFLPQYSDVLATKSDNVAFHSLYKTDNGVMCETRDKFSLIANNSIIDEKIRLYDKEVDKVLS